MCSQSDLDDVAQWICSFQLCLNVIRSSSVLIGSRQRISNKTLNVSVGGKLFYILYSFFTCFTVNQH